MKFKHFTLMLSVLALSNTVLAQEWELTPFVGYSYSNSLDSYNDGSSLSLSNDVNYGLSLAWQDGPNAQGMVSLSRVSHDYTSDTDNKNHSLDVTYAHFNGVAMFRQADYVTTFSLGAGAAYFDAFSNSKLYPSVTAAIGNRYQLQPQLTFVTEIRTFATLTDNEDDLFCYGNGSCTAKFSGAIALETNISIGLAYKF